MINEHNMSHEPGTPLNFDFLNNSSLPNSSTPTPYTINSTDRIILGTWSLVTLLLGGVGNILVLTALHIRRVNIDITSVWFISNMSVSDILYVLFIVVPSVFTNFSNTWLFGEFLCGLTASLSSMFCIIHLLSLTLLSLNKLLRCSFPLRSIYMELKVWSGSLITALMWVLSLGPIAVNYVLKRPFTFDPNLNRCTIHDDNAATFWVNFNKLCFIFYVALPMLICIGANAGLLIIILKKATTVNKAKISMILSLSMLAVGAWVPAAIYGTVFNSSGYPLYLRFINYSISIDTTFSTLVLIYFYPPFGEYFLGVLTCGKKGALSRRETERKRSRAISGLAYTPIKPGLTQIFSSTSLNISRSMVPKLSRSTAGQSQSIQFTPVNE